MLKWLFGLVVVIVLIVGGGAAYWRHELNSPIALNTPRIYEVHEGDGIRATLLRLKSEGIIRQEWPLQLLEIVNRRALTGLKAGEFRLMPNMTLLQMVRKLSSNDVVTYTITVPEGRNFAEMRELFDQAPKLKIETAGLDDQALMARIGHPNEQPEGRFFPATYRYTKGMTDIQLYRQAYNLMSRTLNDVWNDRDPDLPYDSPYQALIMASLVEEEAARASERAKIAGVFVRRLEKGMRLQTDPSVVYGLHLTSGNQLTRADLEQMTPYNTYRISGLTPTPIALPGYASLEAAVHPEEGDALYFVAKGNGYHQFSATLQEHDAAVKRYILDAHTSINQGLGTEIDDSVIALGNRLMGNSGAEQDDQPASEGQTINDQSNENTAADTKESSDSADNTPVAAGEDDTSGVDTTPTEDGGNEAVLHSLLPHAQIKQVNRLFQCGDDSASSASGGEASSDHHKNSMDSLQNVDSLQNDAVCSAMAIFAVKGPTVPTSASTNEDAANDKSSPDEASSDAASTSNASGKADAGQSGATSKGSKADMELEQGSSVDIEAARLFMTPPRDVSSQQGEDIEQRDTAITGDTIDSRDDHADTDHNAEDDKRSDNQRANNTSAGDNSSGNNGTENNSSEAKTAHASDSVSHVAIRAASRVLHKEVGRKRDGDLHGQKG